MRHLFSILFLFFALLIHVNGQTVTMCSWNIQNLGKSKDDRELAFIARTVKDYDLVCVIEVVAGYGGAQAVARLHDELNRTGAKWDYAVSEPTSSFTKGTERYAFLWKSGKLKRIGTPRLEQKYHAELEREPYFITLQAGEKRFTVGVFHAVPASKHPEFEIPYLARIATSTSENNVLFCGDFNCPQSNPAFQPLKSAGYSSALIKQKTTLKNKPVGTDCLASEFDNIFYPARHITALDAGIIPFYQAFQTLPEAKTISDHLPIFMRFSLN